jgi:hypothetical protein
MGAIFIPGQARMILESVVEWLGSNDDSEILWGGKTDNVAFCLDEMRRKISQPVRPAYIGHVPAPNPEIEVFKNALADVESMLAAMRQKNRKLALSAGIAAVGKLA